MKMKVYCLLIVVGILTSACQSSPISTPTSTLTITPTPLPTATPTPEPTPTPHPDQDELRTAWEPAINGGVMIYALCPMILDTAERRQSGEIDGLEAFGEIFAEAAFLDGIDKGFAEWEPEPEVEAYKEAVLAQNNVMKDVLAKWFNDEITSADVPGLLEDECAAIEDTLKSIVEAAKEAGMTEETLGLIVTEFQEGMEEISVELEGLEEEE